MNPGAPNSDELFQLLAELVDGRLTPGQTERLRELLRDNPRAQDIYIKYMGVHAQLYLDYDCGSGPMAMPGGSSMPIRSLSDSSLGPIDRNFLEERFEEAIGPIEPSRTWSPTWVVGSILAAVLLIVGLAVVFRAPRVREAPIAHSLPLTTNAANGLAMVVRLENVHWEMDGGREPREGDIFPQGRLRIRSGHLTLSMLSGVTILVEGPADVELLSMDRVYCHHGKLRVHAPEGAEGFLVSGPGSAVMDIGTEFGLNIQSNGKSRGKVFKGEVEAAVFGQEGNLRRSQFMNEGHNTFEIDPGTGQIETSTKPEDFVAPSVLRVPSLSLDPSYSSEILKANPWSYWRFESVTDGVVPNEISGGYPLRSHGQVRFVATSNTNHSALFRGGEVDPYLVMEGSWEPPRTPGYAIELWFLSDVIGHATLASLIAPKDSDHHLALLELTTRNRLTLFRPASVRFLHRWPPERGGGDNVFSNECYVPYQWHHLVAQVNKNMMEIFLDGNKVSSSPLTQGTPSTACQFLLGRLTTLTQSPHHHTGWRRCFTGQIDEVALYGRPLTSEEVRNHHRLATRAVRPD